MTVIIYLSVHASAFLYSVYRSAILAKHSWPQTAQMLEKLKTCALLHMHVRCHYNLTMSTYDVPYM